MNNRNAWEDRTPFDEIKIQFGLGEQQVIELMRTEMKSSSFKLWRERVQGRKTKHAKLREFEDERFKCNIQIKISNNKLQNDKK